jgi:hypothetical protein
MGAHIELDITRHLLQGQSHESQHEEEFHQLTSERSVPKHHMACVPLSAI